MPDVPDAHRSEPRPADGHESRSDMEHAVARKGDRRLRARQSDRRSVWFGLGMFGVIGWSVAVPSLVGIAIGLWLDSHFQSSRSWTLMLMIAGLGVGSWNAWCWVHREMAASEERSSDSNEESSA